MPRQSRRLQVNSAEGSCCNVNPYSLLRVIHFLQGWMSALEIPKQHIPVNNNNNGSATTTKGIVKALINRTSPPSDSENRPMSNGSAKKSPARSVHGSSKSPASHLKQSTIPFANNVKSHSVLKMSDFSTPPKSSDSSSSSSPYSSDDEVLIVTQQKREEPLSEFH